MESTRQSTMQLRDIKRYRGYMPIRMEREDTVKWLASLVGTAWEDDLWLGKYSKYHTVRYRFGDINEIQFYMKDKTWQPMPIALWMKFIHRDESKLDDECWTWIRAKRKEYGIESNAVKAVARSPHSSRMSLSL